MQRQQPPLERMREPYAPEAFSDVFNELFGPRVLKERARMSREAKEMIESLLA